MRSLVEMLSHVGIHWRLRKMHGFRPITCEERNDVALRYQISEHPLTGSDDRLPLSENHW